jgi:hypothetical protein
MVKFWISLIVNEAQYFPSQDQIFSTHILIDKQIPPTQNPVFAHHLPIFYLEHLTLSSKANPLYIPNA